jgi:hypothetical protein
VANPGAVAAHLRACEETLLDPAVRRDRAQVERLLDHDFMEFGSSGLIWAREQILDLLATEIYTPPSVKDFKCALLAETIALVTYRAVRTDSISSLESATLCSSIWVSHSGSWWVRFHQGTRQHSASP